MKRYIKIITLALSCLLLIGAAVGIAASASETPSVTIAKKNIAYEGAPKILYAVSATGIEVDYTLHMVFYNELPESLPSEGDDFDAESTDYSYVKEQNGTATINQEEYALVYSRGTSPSEMTKPIYSVAVAVDSDGKIIAVSELCEYSVYTYAMNMFKKGATGDQLALYTSLLEYGGAVARVLVESGDSNATDIVSKYGYADESHGRGLYASASEKYDSYTPTGSYTDYMSVVSDDFGNNYLKVSKTNYAGSIYNDQNTVSGTDIEDNYKIVFETDMKWNGAGDNGVGTVENAIYLEIMRDTNYMNNLRHGDYAFVQNIDGSLSYLGQTLPKERWFNLRIELIKNTENPAKIDAYIYINNVEIYSKLAFVPVTGDATDNAIMFDDITSFRFNIRSVAPTATVCFDNMYCSRVALSEGSTDNEGESRGEGVYASASEKYDSYTPIGSYTDYMSVVSDNLGDSYLQVSKSNYSKSVYNDQNTVNENGISDGDNYKIVFETDIKWNGEKSEAADVVYLEIMKNTSYMNNFRHGDYAFAQNSDGSLSYLGETLPNGEWFNLRIEICENAEDNTKIDIYVYINNELILFRHKVAAVTSSNASITLDDITSFRFNIRKTVPTVTVCFDNTYCSRVAISE